MKKSLLLSTFLLAGLLLAGCDTDATEADNTPTAPGDTTRTEGTAWAVDAVFYQIFPERFRNGDPTNDPPRESLEWHADVPENWAVSPWTGDWYARAEWEKQTSDNFYDTVYHRRYGGDLQGVLDKLDYLDDLGINTIYFNPVFYARSLHKYDGNTYHHIDPNFGPDPEGDFALMAEETSDPATWHWTAADSLFLTLLREAHAREIRIIIDGVFNHTGRDFFAFLDLHENQEASPYKDWYIVNRFDDPASPENEFDYEGWWGVESLPVFADTEDGANLHPGPRQYVFDATARWMDPNADGDPSDGIDGWRLDVANEMPIGFWADWNAHVRRLNPEAYTVTEIWHDASQFLQDGGFTATMNYHGFAFPVKAYLIDNAVPSSQFTAMLNARREEYPEPMQYQLQNLIDSHDVDRLASSIVNRSAEDAGQEQYGYDRAVSPMQNPDYELRAPNDQERALQRLVALFQMTYVGPPMIYYGTEAGMWGADDPDDRKPMVWPDLAYAAEATDPRGRARTPDPVAFDSTLFRFYQEVIGLRNAHDVLRRGDFGVLLSDEERNLVAFSRTLDDETMVVVLNRSDTAHSLRLPLPEPLRGSYEPAFATEPDGYRVQQDPEALLIEIPERTGLVLHRVPASSL